MRVLLIKTSSLGDVVHTLPAVTDASRAIWNLQIDWLVEEAFTEIPSWHPAVTRVLPVAVRRWCKDVFNVRHDGAWQRLRSALDNQSYDLILDAQGLLKSAWLGCLADGPRAGLDRASVREALASFFYQKRFSVAKGQHAVERTRQLFAQAFEYALPMTTGNFGIERERVSTDRLDAHKLVFLHGTTWASKHYPETYWIELAKIARRKELARGVALG
jgi:heptosyltransferase I